MFGGWQHSPNSGLATRRGALPPSERRGEGSRRVLSAALADVAGQASLHAAQRACGPLAAACAREGAGALSAGCGACACVRVAPRVILCVRVDPSFGFVGLRGVTWPDPRAMSVPRAGEACMREQRSEISGSGMLHVCVPPCAHLCVCVERGACVCVSRRLIWIRQGRGAPTGAPRESVMCEQHPEACTSS